MAKQRPQRLNRVVRVLFGSRVVTAGGTTRHRTAEVVRFEPAPALETVAAASQRFWSSDTDSRWNVCGNMSTTRVCTRS